MVDAELTKLIRQAANGDEEAFGRIYDEFAEALYKFVKFKVTDQEQAEDILQDVFIKAWKGIPGLTLTDLNFSAWLYTVAGNTVNDYFRRVYRRPQTVTLSPDFEIASPHDTSKATETAINTKHLHAALDKLSPDYKQVLELRFIQEFSVEETARILAKTTVGTRVLQYRALKKLETIYKRHLHP